MRPFYIVFLLTELLCRGRDSIILPCKKAPFLFVYVGNAITKDQSHTRQERPNKVVQICSARAHLHPLFREIQKNSKK